MSDDEAVWNADILSLAVLSEHSCDAEYKRAGKAVLKQFPQWMVKKEREDYKKGTKTALYIGVWLNVWLSLFLILNVNFTLLTLSYNSCAHVLCLYTVLCRCHSAAMYCFIDRKYLHFFMCS